MFLPFGSLAEGLVITTSVLTRGEGCNVIKGSRKIGCTIGVTLRITGASLSILVAKRDKIKGRIVPHVVRSGDQHGGGGCFTIGYNSVPRNAVSSRLFKRRGNTFAKTINRHRNCFKTTGNNALFLSRIKRLPVTARTHLLEILRAKRCVHINSDSMHGASMHVITTAGIGVTRTVQSKHFRRSLFCHLGAVPVGVPTLHRQKSSIILLFGGFTVSATRGCGVPSPLRLARRTRLGLGGCP